MGKKIKPVKRMTGSGQAQAYDQGFELLSHAITVIFQKQARELSYELLFRTAYTLTMDFYGERLYYDVERVIGEHLEQVTEATVVPAFMNSSIDVGTTADAGAGFLKTVEKVWDDFTTGLDLIQQVFYYLNQRLPKYGLPGIYDMGLNLFRDKVILSEKYPIKRHLIAAMLTQIQLERDGDVIDKSAIQSSVSMLVELMDKEAKVESVYVVDFEKEFLDTSRSFYQQESQMLVANYDAPEFMRKVDTRLEEEYERTIHCLNISTEPKIRVIVETELIANNLNTLMEMNNSGLESMLAADKYGDLSRMYHLFSRVPVGLGDMKAFISQYIITLGTDINKSISNELKSKDKGGNIAIRWVTDVLALQDKFDLILEHATNKDKSFQIVFNDAFEKFINENQKSAEFISLFIDENLKKGLKGKSEDEVDDILDKTITLFRFLQDKDVFERYYKQHLAKRLLFNRSVSDDAERGMLSKLKRECGYQFTNKLEGMFNDMRLSSDMISLYKEYMDKSNDKSPLDMTVNVLTSTFWPMNLAASPKCTFPTLIGKARASFEKFYLERHNGRRLTWQPQMGTADIRAHFDSGKHHTLNVSTYGMVVLVLFNDHDHLSYADIKTHTQIADPELKRTLQSLACAKYKLLNKSVKSREIDETETFSFNGGFTCNLARIKIQTLASKVESDSERKHTQSKVDEERKHQIEAAVVRIMKDRKTMEHNLLIAEVTKQLSARFMPSPIMIKKRIEALIDREYLERSTEDRRAYHYLA